MHLTIAYDAKRLFHNQTGLGNYSRTLLEGLIRTFPENRYLLASPLPDKHPWNEIFFNPPCELVSPSAGTPGWFWRAFTMMQSLKTEKIQLFHGLSGELPRIAGKKNFPFVLTVHDLLFEEFPEDYSYFDRNIHNLKLKHGLKYADAIIAISESTRRAIEKKYPEIKHKVKVVYQGVDPFFSKKEDAEYIQNTRNWHALPESFLLFTGSWGGRKNLSGVVAALKISGLDIPLVITGNIAEKEYIGLKYKNVIRLRNLDKRALRALYILATALVYPSKGEGFGLPVVEAMMAGTPVITSNRSSLTEAAGNAALLVDPFNPDDISEALKRITSDETLRKTLIEKGFEQTKRFDMHTAAQKIMEIYLSLQP
jgi:glycosyltransferase involved in cell wall biosynthesis